MPKKLELKSEEVRLVNITKRFGEVIAVRDLSLIAGNGKITTLLGPSGCGKTTTLRIIAGFYEPDEGEIFIGEKRVNGVPPYKRSTRTVFQNYALFPHMTVFENIKYGLEIQKKSKEEIKESVKEILELVDLSGLENRLPGQLSGGQQQRVAFARALVTRPNVLLLDEPLSNLDAKLRVHMREEVKRLQQELGITTIYVTHDQEEAMSISDTIAVMNEGRIEQVGPPSDIYERPKTRFVAEFIGLSNFLPAKVIGVDGTKTVVEVLGIKTIVPTIEEIRPGDLVTLVTRPERLNIIKEKSEAIAGRVISSTYLGTTARYRVKLENGMEMIVDEQAPLGEKIYHRGEKIFLRLQEGKSYIQRKT